MKRYTSSQVRERLADVLDAAERGEEVIIERRGVRYVVRAERPRVAPRTRKPLIRSLDPGVGAGEWTWTWKADGLTFSSKRWG
jgi:antitoxin (DNA-binding transcriptional repressor) of toxin-antitoxin stability system